MPGEQQHFFGDKVIIEDYDENSFEFKLGYYGKISEEFGDAFRTGYGYAVIYKNPGYKGSGSQGPSKNGSGNVVEYAKYKEVLRTTEAANPLVNSLRQTGTIPSNFITKAEAEVLGWRPGKALENYAPGKQIGGDVFENTSQVLPSAPGRIWYEADVGLVGTMSRSKQPGTRLLYSNDGQLYVTYDHYQTVHSIGDWK